LSKDVSDDHAYKRLYRLRYAALSYRDSRNRDSRNRDSRSLVAYNQAHFDVTPPQYWSASFVSVVQPRKEKYKVTRRSQSKPKTWWYIGGAALLVLALVPSLQQQFERNKQHAMAVQACGGVDRIAEVTAESYRCIE
jgi:NADH:ubiquinone oxidoreductase subunit